MIRLSFFSHLVVANLRFSLTVHLSKKYSSLATRLLLELREKS